MAENKVVYGLKNVHYAVITEESDDVIVYEAPARIRGAVNLTMTPTGEETEFSVTNILWL